MIVADTRRLDERPSELPTVRPSELFGLAVNVASEPVAVRPLPVGAGTLVEGLIELRIERAARLHANAGSPP